MAMTLGGYTFTQNPCEPLPVITEERRAQAEKTLGGAEFFSWGSFIAGVELELYWTSMPTGQYGDLLTLLKADAKVVWNPENGSTYNVQILSLNGQYHLSAAAAATWRKQVKLKLVIISQAT